MILQVIPKTMMKNKASYHEREDLMDEPHQVNVAGWREWVELPDIGGPCIEAKIDTKTKIFGLTQTTPACSENHQKNDMSKGPRMPKNNYQPMYLTMKKHNKYRK